MKGNIAKHFLLLIFIFALSLVNISPLFAKKEKEADKTAVNTEACKKKDANKTGAAQYSETCKTQCTSKEAKFSQFQKENKDVCDLFPALITITKEQQEIESLVQDVVKELNKIEDTAENTAALEAIIPEFPSPTSKEFTITFSDKLKKALETIIFAQPALYNVLNETDKTPETAEKTPIQVRAEAAIKTIILKSFDPLTDTATGKYYEEVIQELRDHWLNLDLKGDATTKEATFTVANFKSAIFGSIGYSLPHELYHFEFDEALTKAIKDNAESDAAAKKAFLEAYKKYIETNIKIEIQSETWKKDQPLLFKISLTAAAGADPGIKCTSTEEKYTKFQADNVEVCKLVADTAGTNRKLNTEACKAKDTSKSGADQYSETCKTQCILKDPKFAKFQEDSAEACKIVADAVKADTATAETEATKAETERDNAVNHRKTAESKSNEALEAKDIQVANTALATATAAALNAITAASASRNAATAALVAAKRIPSIARAAANTSAINANSAAKEASIAGNTARSVALRARAIITIKVNLKIAKNNRILAERKRKEAKNAPNVAAARNAANESVIAADKAEEAAASIAEVAKFLPYDTFVQNAAEEAHNFAYDAREVSNDALRSVPVVPQTSYADEVV